MVRLALVEILFDVEIAIVHVRSRMVRRCSLFGAEVVRESNYDFVSGGSMNS